MAGVECCHYSHYVFFCLASRDYSYNLCQKDAGRGEAWRRGGIPRRGAHLSRLGYPRGTAVVSQEALQGRGNPRGHCSGVPGGTAGEGISQGALQGRGYPRGHCSGVPGDTAGEGISQGALQWCLRGHCSGVSGAVQWCPKGHCSDVPGALQWCPRGYYSGGGVPGGTAVEGGILGGTAAEGVSQGALALQWRRCPRGH